MLWPYQSVVNQKLVHAAVEQTGVLPHRTSPNVPSAEAHADLITFVQAAGTTADVKPFKQKKTAKINTQMFVREKALEVRLVPATLFLCTERYAACIVRKNTYN